MEKYDFIITGAGAAGILMAKALMEDPFFSRKRILILDKDDKSVNDRTWCFWEKGSGSLEHLVRHRWCYFEVAGKRFRKTRALAPYSYKVIHGIDLYNYFKQVLLQWENFTFRQEEVISIGDLEDTVVVDTATAKYEASFVFDSIPPGTTQWEGQSLPWLKQHFIGWTVETDRDVFDPETATFMDFSIPQKESTRFMYVLPFSPRRALLEYTVFSQELLPEVAYGNGIKDYLQTRWGNPNYTIAAIEKGNIPMTSYDFAKHNTPRHIRIGSTGGWTQPSTGFTFKNSLEQTQNVVSSLKDGRLKNYSPRKKNRHWYYDLLLLKVLSERNNLGSSIFGNILETRTPQLLFRFLDAESSIWEDLKIISACPTKPFAKAAVSQILNGSSG